MVHMTCRRTKTAKEDLAYVVKRFLRAEALEKNVSRTPTDSHTQTASSDEQQTQVKVVSLLNFVCFCYLHALQTKIVHIILLGMHLIQRSHCRKSYASSAMVFVP